MQPTTALIVKSAAICVQAQASRNVPRASRANIWPALVAPRPALTANTLKIRTICVIPVAASVPPAVDRGQISAYRAPAGLNSKTAPAWPAAAIINKRIRLL